MGCRLCVSAPLREYWGVYTPQLSATYTGEIRAPETRKLPSIQILLNKISPEKKIENLSNLAFL